MQARMEARTELLEKPMGKSQLCKPMTDQGGSDLIDWEEIEVEQMEVKQMEVKEIEVEQPGFEHEEMELTAGDIYDALHEQVALARTRALMGEWQQAQALFESSHNEYLLYREVLQGLPLHALEHAFTETRQILCLQQTTDAEPLPELTHTQREESQKPRSRKRISRAA